MREEMFSRIALYDRLPQNEQQFLCCLAKQHPFTFQQLRMLVEYSADLVCWQQGSLQELYHPESLPDISGKKRTTFLFEQLREGYLAKKEGMKTYARLLDNQGTALSDSEAAKKQKIIQVEQQGSIMGRCPVASEKTRCCNLQTLDAVQQCGFDCSYCSIQSFYHGGQVRFIENLAEQLDNIEIDASRHYHIGTGQSSDSLMWGNSLGLLDALCRFAQKYPNVVLEMKSKSSRIDYFLKHQPPPNMVFTWSLNTPVVISHEEKGTANLERRLASARKLADRGIPVGFHFHPIVWYQGWQKDYLDVVATLVATFKPEEVVMVSLGTLTFIKSVVKRIRSRMLESSILQMPMEECAGKLSYPLAIKKDLFYTVYQAFPEVWKKQIFFYLCMEAIELWEPVFGRSYATNEDFEQDMVQNYLEKIKYIASACC